MADVFFGILIELHKIRRYKYHVDRNTCKIPKLEVINEINRIVETNEILKPNMKKYLPKIEKHIGEQD